MTEEMLIQFKRMKQAGYMAQCFAWFTYMPYTQERDVDPFEYAKALSDTMDRESKQLFFLLSHKLSILNKPYEQTLKPDPKVCPYGKTLLRNPNEGRP